MKKIIELQSKEELDQYINKKTLKYIDDGSEGECFLGSDGLAYKIYFDVPFINDHELIDIEDIITESDFKLDSFAFPKVIFTIDDVVKCYTSKYVKENLFGYKSKESAEVLLEHIKGKEFVSAYNKFVEDLEVLTSNRIKLFDLCNNLLYDGENLVAIDTIYYKQENEADIDILREFNLRQFRAALIEVFSFALRICDKECDIEFDEDTSIEEFIEDVLIRYNGEEALLRKLFG